ncbi:hypothetical protein ACFU3E_12630, partial [Streptomyces sp. NPDC057424]
MTATHIRDLLLGRIGGALDPRGIRLAGARITGHLDLTDVCSSIPVQLDGCRFDEPVILVRAELPALSLRSAVLPSLCASRVSVRHCLDLAGLTVTSRGGHGAVQLEEACIGQLDLVGATLTNDDGPALLADGLRVGSGVRLVNLTATGHGERGAVRLSGAHIDGQLDLMGATLTND